MKRSVNEYLKKAVEKERQRAPIKMAKVIQVHNNRGIMGVDHPMAKDTLFYNEVKKRNQAIINQKQ